MFYLAQQGADAGDNSLLHSTSGASINGFGFSGIKPLSGLLGDNSQYHTLGGAWIKNRGLLNSRKWAPGSALSVHVAKQAVEDAGLNDIDLKETAVLVGSSRGNVAGWTIPGVERRAFDLLAASNSMHGELASAVSIELGTRGPWQVISSGCAASLDAMGMASMMIKQGVIKRAIVLGVELPLIGEILNTYAKTGVLATSEVNDPYSKNTSGFFPGEAGAAIVLESVSGVCERHLRAEAISEDEDVTACLWRDEELVAKSLVRMTGYWCNSDAESPIGMPVDGAGLRDCVKSAVEDLTSEPPILGICPHASGTLLHGKAELAALRDALPNKSTISLHPLKPYTGHTVGASGVLDTVILAHYLRNKKLPPNLPGLTVPSKPFDLNANQLSYGGATVLKIAVGMGGHNSIVAMRPPSV